MGKEDFGQFKLMMQFANHVGDILALFAKIVQPRSFEDLKKYGLHDPPETVDPPPLNWSTLRYVFGHEKEDRNAEKAPQA